MDTQALLTPAGARIALVVNAGSRRGRDALEASRAVLVDAGARRLEAHGVTSGEELIATLDRVVARRPDLPIVGGGDGTVGAAAARVARTDVVLGVLPLGTANDFARTLELSRDPALAAPEGSTTKHVLPWIWSSQTSGGRPLTSAGEQLGAELRLSRYAKPQFSG